MDNFDNNINNNLEDKAWASMKVLLDKELPEIASPTLSEIDAKEKKKRRFLFFYLFVFGLIGTGLGYNFYAQKNDINEHKINLENNIANINRTEENSHLIDENIAKKSENTEGVTSKNNKPIQSNKSVNKLNNTNLVNSKNNTNLIQNKNLQSIDNQLVIRENNIDFNSENNTQIKSIIEPNKPNIVVEKYINSNIKSDTNSAILNQNNKEIIKENNIIAEAKIIEKEEPYIASIKSISSTDLIDILQPQPIYLDHKNELNKEDKLLKKLSKIRSKKWSYGLVLGLNTEGSVKTSNVFGGVFLHRELNAKWSFNTGINYRILSKNVSEVEYLQSNDIAFQKSSSGLQTGNTSNGNLLKVNKAYLQNIMYLETPIQINYKLSRKFSFFSGVKIAYLVSQNVGTKASDTPLFVSNNQVYGSFLDRVIAENNYTSSDLGLNKWDWGLIGGANYNLTKRFSLQIRYDLGLTDIYKGGDVSVYNYFLGLNGAYRF